MEEALLFCSERYPGQDIVLAAQRNLADFYASLGFAVASKPYDDFGVMHVEMSIHGRASAV